ncbi:MAG: CoA-binding protein [Epsilonproteobacteria bacterium]|nr:MAG: CoA-binding protein [Campylobacterota bacterium]
MECEIPRINSNNEQMIEYFKTTKNIAVVGVSPNPEKASNKVAKYLKEVGYKMIPIYPKEEYILGEKVYRNLAEIDMPVDMVVIFRKPAALDGIADAVIARGDVKTYWTQLELINNDAAKRVKDAGINVVQNHCAMIEHKALI